MRIFGLLLCAASVLGAAVGDVLWWLYLIVGAAMTIVGQIEWE